MADIRIQELMDFLSSRFPLAWQEEYDNCGLQVGDPQAIVRGLLTCLDTTEAVLEEAISVGANVIVSHHPILFQPLKKLSGHKPVERILLKAVRQNLAIIAMHTNMDNALEQGVNEGLGKRLGLQQMVILQPKNDLLAKVTLNLSHAEFKVLFPALESLQPASLVFLPGESEAYPGQAAISLFRDQLPTLRRLVGNLFGETPFLSVAPLLGSSPRVGAGMIGYLPQQMAPDQFFSWLRERLPVKVVRHTRICRDTISKVAICGGSGSFLLQEAMAAGADIFVSADFKYHQFQEADDRIIIADIGHYESEEGVISQLSEIISGKFPTFAVRSTSVCTNFVVYNP